MSRVAVRSIAWLGLWLSSATKDDLLPVIQSDQVNQTVSRPPWLIELLRVDEQRVNKQTTTQRNNASATRATNDRRVHRMVRSVLGIHPLHNLIANILHGSLRKIRVFPALDFDGCKD